jgi:hypothetical protein
MKIKTIVVFVAGLLPATFVFSQNTGSHEIGLGYGIYSVNEVKDPNLYLSVNSYGLLSGRYMHNLNGKFAIGAEYSYEKLRPLAVGSQGSDSLYREVNFFMGKLRFVLLEKNRLRLYLAGSAGLKIINQNLPFEENYTREVIKEVVVIGLDYKLFQGAIVFGELTTGELALIKLGVSLRL